MKRYGIQWQCLMFTQPGEDGAAPAAHRAMEELVTGQPYTTLLYVYDADTETRYFFDMETAPPTLLSTVNHVAKAEWESTPVVEANSPNAQLVGWRDRESAYTPEGAAIMAWERLQHLARNRGFSVDVVQRYKKYAVGVYLLTEEQIANQWGKNGQSN
jgi:hypothetical protein